MKNIVRNSPVRNAVQEPGLGEEHQHEYSERGHCELGARKSGGAVRHDRVHDRIRLDHAPIEQLQSQECICTGEQHRARGEEEQPGMMPVQEDDVSHPRFGDVYDGARA